MAEPAVGLVELAVLIDPDDVVVIVRDFGRWHAPGSGSSDTSPTHRAWHGRGITLMNALVEHVAPPRSRWHLRPAPQREEDPAEAGADPDTGQGHAMSADPHQRSHSPQRAEPDRHVLEVLTRP